MTFFAFLLHVGKVFESHYNIFCFLWYLLHEKALTWWSMQLCRLMKCFELWCTTFPLIFNGKVRSCRHNICRLRFALHISRHFKAMVTFSVLPDYICRILSMGRWNINLCKLLRGYKLQCVQNAMMQFEDVVDCFTSKTCHFTLFIALWLNFNSTRYSYFLVLPEQVRAPLSMDNRKLLYWLSIFELAWFQEVSSSYLKTLAFGSLLSG